MGIDEKLRPIGTEFEVMRPPDYATTDPHGHRVRYRIVDHKTVATTGKLTEIIECIECIPIERGWGDQIVCTNCGKIGCPSEYLILGDDGSLRASEVTVVKSHE